MHTRLRSGRDLRSRTDADYVCRALFLADMVVVPEMIGSVIAIYNGKVFNTVEIKPEMTGHYLAEFSMSYIPTRHGKPGLGANSSRFIPLK